MLRAFITDDRGATAIENALVAAFIALAMLTVVGLAGKKLYDQFMLFAAELGEPPGQGAQNQKK